MKPTKPTKETLSRSYILETTLKIIDQIGLHKFSMRKLGEDMNVSPMAVYRYFPNQDALFDGLVEWIWQAALIEKEDSTNDGWQEQLINIMTHLRQALLKHPNALPLISTHPLVTKAEFILVENILVNLKKKGLELQPTTVFLINSLTSYTLGFVWTEAIEPKHGGHVDSVLMKELQDGSELLNSLLKSIQDKQFTSEEQFLMGIRAILVGWK
ncbi:TetR/AcrR family transcriptional regulator [Liquorilactobacillus mali]|uniref:TetR/AcrR family transcriptional regulator n=1 Tax=Liquorilactobacillus mali TaxID=1618 RepID=UPI0029541582|nr:TetR/AcrR family transcriptional regulator [Liquorilactobacillus mali]MDV7758606.1 TetR family transcriptional regulator [Liquorilactobacillus mali]